MKDGNFGIKASAKIESIYYGILIGRLRDFGKVTCIGNRKFTTSSGKNNTSRMI